MSADQGFLERGERLADVHEHLIIVFRHGPAEDAFIVAWEKLPHDSGHVRR
ncbi:MAG TPA: hypothetical protein VJT77_01565 [Burkholderiales bacterium]|nr:hypothetical protein [Burkholderiales bacterium]